ncbi:MAG: hypothetical protein RSD33_00665 [Clostridium sp.]
MDLFECIKEVPIRSNCKALYEGMAFDGCCYYFLIPYMRKIMKTNECFAEPEYYETCRDYTCICYDYEDDCFWAASKKCCNKIFKLDCCFKEVDCLFLNDNKESGNPIVGISYDCHDNTLLIAFSGCIAELNKDTGQLCIIFSSTSVQMASILSISPGYIFTAEKDNNLYLFVVDCNNQIVKDYCIHKDCVFKNMVLNPCSDCGNLIIDCLAIKKGCYPHIIKTEIHPDDLGFCPNPCNYDICKEYCNHSSESAHDTCLDLIGSIALVETALSHILNAEGEKIQKVLASTCDIEQILRVNREVNKTIINTTHLEQALYAKLSLAVDCCRSGDSGGCSNVCDCYAGMDTGHDAEFFNCNMEES